MYLNDNRLSKGDETSTNNESTSTPLNLSKPKSSSNNETFTPGNGKILIIIDLY